MESTESNEHAATPQMTPCNRCNSLLFQKTLKVLIQSATLDFEFFVDFCRFWVALGCMQPCATQCNSVQLCATQCNSMQPYAILWLTQLFELHWVAQSRVASSINAFRNISRFYTEDDLNVGLDLNYCATLSQVVYNLHGDDLNKRLKP